MNSLTTKFKQELIHFRDMVESGKYTEIELDNESSRLKEMYSLESKLSDVGYKNLKRILDKYWSGKRLDDQELTIAYILCPKIILYEKVVFRIYDMINEIEDECKQRWGFATPSVKFSRVIMNMCEPNPDYIAGDDTPIVIEAIRKNTSYENAKASFDYTSMMYEQEKSSNLL